MFCRNVGSMMGKFGALILIAIASAVGPTAPARSQIVQVTADDFVGEYAGTCRRQMDRDTGAFRLSLRNGKSGIQGKLDSTGGTVIARYGPISFSKGRMQANDLVLVNRGGTNFTHVSRSVNGEITFNYVNAGGLLICTGSPVGTTPQ